MATIRVTPATLESQGNDLINYAAELTQILDMITAKMAEIDESWDGLAQNAYTAMYESMQESLKQFPELVNGLGDATVSAAQAFSQLDETLQSSFAQK